MLRSLVLLTSGLAMFGCADTQVQRIGSVIAIKRADTETYKTLCTDMPDAVGDAMADANISKYSVYLGAREHETDQYYLFRHFEYTGKDLAADISGLMSDERAANWWARAAAVQTPLPTAPKDETWSDWKLVFYTPGAKSDRKNYIRHGAIIGLRPEPENIIAYTQLHLATWPGVLAAIARGNIKDFAIYHGQIEVGTHMLFYHFEYVGDDFKGDMESIGKDKITQVWWTYTDPLQIRLPNVEKDGQWTTIPEVHHVR